MSTVTTKDLRQIKGLGPTKASLIHRTLSEFDDPEAVTKEDLAKIRGVSHRLAESVLDLVRSNGEPVKPPAKKATRKRTATRQAPSNGTTKLAFKAGTLRLVARTLDEGGSADEAARIRSAVADLLDDETVPQDRLA